MWCLSPTRSLVRSVRTGDKTHSPDSEPDILKNNTAGAFKNETEDPEVNPGSSYFVLKLDSLKYRNYSTSDSRESVPLVIKPICLRHNTENLSVRLPLTSSARLNPAEQYYTCDSFKACQ